MSKAASKDFKICLLGEGRVGKTSIVNRWINNIFDPDQQSTVDAQMYLKKKLFVDGQARQIALWDTAGQERYRALGNLYYRNADGAVLVYDCTDEDTLDRVRTWIKELQRAANPDLQIVICGNKCDRTKERQVSEERGQKFARKYQAEHFSTSAKANIGIDEAFLQVIRNIVAVKEGRLSGNGIDDLGNDDLFGNLTADISSSSGNNQSSSGKKSSKKSKSGGGRLKIVDDEQQPEGDDGGYGNSSNNGYGPGVSASGTTIGGSRISASAERSTAGGDDWLPSSGGTSSKNHNNNDDDDENPYGEGGYYSAYNNNYKGRGGDDDEDEDDMNSRNNNNKKQAQNSSSKKKSNQNIYPTEEEEDDENNHDDYAIDNDATTWNTTSSKKQENNSTVKKSTPATTQATASKPQEKPKTITLGELPKKTEGQQQEKKCSC